jgi:BirA family biotin operon repressor/biotin-[acetyl-CoA-carboxylase] ligase
VTADVQTAGRGRQGRTWSAPPRQALLLALVVRGPDPLLSLRAGLAVADLAGERARVKWPNDVLIEDRKVAGVLVEGRPQEGWAIAGIGVNAALDVTRLPPEVRELAATLGRSPDELEAVLGELLRALETRLGAPAPDVLSALRERDALLGRTIRWNGGTGTAAGIAEDGGLRLSSGDVLHAGEVHLAAGGL